jgi:hypothetical protein
VRAHAISSHSGFPSDTNLLVDACIARVRVAARLDDDAVLPPLPRVAPRRDVVMFSNAAALAGALGAAAVARARARADRTPEAPVVSRRRSSSSPRSRWGIAVCALVASAFGTAAFLGSPAGRAPSVVRATDAAYAHASAAAHATAGLFTR